MVDKDRLSGAKELGERLARFSVVVSSFVFARLSRSFDQSRANRKEKACIVSFSCLVLVCERTREIIDLRDSQPERKFVKVQ